MQDLNTPILCVRCWKLADYVQLDTLKHVAGSSLGDHFNAMALLCTSGVLGERQPDCLRHFFDAFQEVCADIPPIRIIFVSFLWVTRFETGLMPRTLDILKENPTVNKALLRLLIYSKFKHKPNWIPDIVNIERHIQNRIEVAVRDEVTCSQCRLRVNTRNEPIFYNPFPVGQSSIGTLVWCKVCVAMFNEYRNWPWRDSGSVDSGKVEVEIWSLVSSQEEQQH